MKYLGTHQITILQKCDNIESFQRELNKFGSTSPSIIMLIKNIYSFSTMQEMSIEQKQCLINFILQLVSEIPHLKTTKAQFLTTYENRIYQLSRRTNSNVKSKFTHQDTLNIKHFFEQQILPYYDIYQFVLDSNPEFNFVAEQFNPIPSIQEQPIIQGQMIQVQSVQALKQFVGERQPKQEKKDPKKK